MTTRFIRVTAASVLALFAALNAFAAPAAAVGSDDAQRIAEDSWLARSRQSAPIADAAITGEALAVGWQASIQPDLGQQAAASFASFDAARNHGLPIHYEIVGFVPEIGTKPMLLGGLWALAWVYRRRRPNPRA